jgi:hypothetical protein
VRERNKAAEEVGRASEEAALPLKKRGPETSERAMEIRSLSN